MRLVSRNERDHTRRFPELVEALTMLKPKTSTSTLDGERATASPASSWSISCERISA